MLSSYLKFEAGCPASTASMSVKSTAPLQYLNMFGNFQEYGVSSFIFEIFWFSGDLQISTISEKLQNLAFVKLCYIFILAEDFNGLQFTLLRNS